MVVFEGRILQCSQGHAVCETCQAKLLECPHCRGVYVGTRNYTLEAIIAKLKQFSNDINENGDPCEVKSTNEAPEGASEPEPNLPEVIPPEPEPATLPVQLPAPKGLYQCHMLNCTEKLPFCRLLNHLRYFHKDNLTETNRTTNSNDEDYVHHWTMPSVTFRKCFHLHNLGIFFLIVNVPQPVASGDVHIRAWVQCPYPNNVARNFRFSLELLIGEWVATFTDYVVGAQSDSHYIQSNGNCLNFISATEYDRFTIEMRISKTVGRKDLLRNKRTDVRILPALAGLSPQGRAHPPENVDYIEGARYV